MDTKIHIQNAIGVTSALFLLTVLSKVLTDSYTNTCIPASIELLNHSIRYKKQSQQDSVIFIKFQHLVLAIAYLNAARKISKDNEIERTTGIDLNKLHKNLEDQISVCINNLNNKTSKKTKFNLVTF